MDLKNVRDGSYYLKFLIRFMMILSVTFFLISTANAQEVEPRGLTNVPIGTNFVVAGYGYSYGNTLLDPALPLEDLKSDVHGFVLAYVRSINFFSMSGKLDVILPWAAGNWDGILEGEQRHIKRDGFGDPRVRLAFNFYGAPAYEGPFDPTKSKETIAGAQLQIIVPLGEYMSDKLINLGSNRWTFQPKIGIAHTIGDWILEAYTGIWIFTDNDDFFGGLHLEQKPLVTANIHAIYSLPPHGSWLGLGIGYGIGGRTVINGVEKDTRISSIRVGLVYAIPLSRQHALKLTLASGKRFERGPDFDGIALSYQYLW